MTFLIFQRSLVKSQAMPDVKHKATKKGSSARSTAQYRELMNAKTNKKRKCLTENFPDNSPGNLDKECVFTVSFDFLTKKTYEYNDA